MPVGLEASMQTADDEHHESTCVPGAGLTHNKNVGWGLRLCSGKLSSTQRSIPSNNVLRQQRLQCRIVADERDVGQVRSAL
jgi:hypothetical protein